VFRHCLAISALATSLSAQQLPERQIQLHQQRDAEERGEQQRRELIRAQHEREEREHADELLIQRRAEAERQRQVQTPEQSAPPQFSPEVVAAPIVDVQPKYDFSARLLARSLGVGLLAGACALLLGKDGLVACMVDT